MTLDQAEVDERAVEVVRTLLRWAPVLGHEGRGHPDVVAGDAHRRVAAHVLVTATGGDRQGSGDQRCGQQYLTPTTERNMTHEKLL